MSQYRRTTLAEAYLLNDKARAQQGAIGWEWRSTDGAETCKACLDMDGKKFPMSRPFEPLHPNCKCEAKPLFS